MNKDSSKKNGGRRERKEVRKLRLCERGLSIYMETKGKGGIIVGDGMEGMDESKKGGKEGKN